MNLAETIAGAIEALRQSASGLASTVDVEVPPDLPPALGDADQIEQVLINLLTNADQAIAGAGIAGRIVVSARLDAAEGMVPPSCCGCRSRPTCRTPPLLQPSSRRARRPPVSWWSTTRRTWSS